MNRLRELSSQVMDVYQTLSNEFSAYQQAQSLNCVAKCGACCNNPDIEVSPLEMLPYALYLFDSGQVDQKYNELGDYNGFSCMQYQRLSLDGNEGFCGIYEYRPAICRMFGAAGYKTKFGVATLSVCKPIKSSVPDKYSQALIAMENGAAKPPMLAIGRQKVAQLDFELGEKLMPINEALRYILDKILTLSYYQGNVDDFVAA